MRCSRQGCNFLANENIKYVSSCCKLCKINGLHGPACTSRAKQKLALGNLPKVVTDISIYSWGKCTYGNYIAFTINTLNIMPRIDQINYKINIITNSSPKLLTSGSIPYLYDNSNVVFSRSIFLDNTVSLSIQTQYKGTLSAYFNSAAKFLSSSAYINCNYFGNITTTTTTTKAPTTRITSTKAPTTRLTTTRLTTTRITTTRLPTTTGITTTIKPALATLGTQIWKTANTNISTYSDGTPIPNVTNLAAWNLLDYGAWCYYNNDPANAKYGKIYNWYAVAGIYNLQSLNNISLRKRFAPTGFRVPTEDDLNLLRSYVATTYGDGTPGSGYASLMEEIDGTNQSGWSGLAGGGMIFGSSGVLTFANLGTIGRWWSSTPIAIIKGCDLYISKNEGIIVRTGGQMQQHGCAVRFISENSATTTTTTTTTTPSTTTTTTIDPSLLPSLQDPPFMPDTNNPLIPQTNISLIDTPGSYNLFVGATNDTKKYYIRLVYATGAGGGGGQGARGGGGGGSALAYTDNTSPILEVAGTVLFNIVIGANNVSPSGATSDGESTIIKQGNTVILSVEGGKVGENYVGTQGLGGAGGTSVTGTWASSVKKKSGTSGQTNNSTGTNNSGGAAGENFISFPGGNGSGGDGNTGSQAATPGLGGILAILFVRSLYELTASGQPQQFTLKIPFSTSYFVGTGPNDTDLYQITIIDIVGAGGSSDGSGGGGAGAGIYYKAAANPANPAHIRLPGSTVLVLKVGNPASQIMEERKTSIYNATTSQLLIKVSGGFDATSGQGGVGGTAYAGSWYTSFTNDPSLLYYEAKDGRPGETNTTGTAAGGKSYVSANYPGYGDGADFVPNSTVNGKNGIINIAVTK